MTIDEAALAAEKRTTRTAAGFGAPSWSRGRKNRSVMVVSRIPVDCEDIGQTRMRNVPKHDYLTARKTRALIMT